MYNCEGIEFPAGPKDWEKFEKQKWYNCSWYIICTTQYKRNKCCIQIEYNHKRKNHVNLLMITDGNKWHYLAVSDLSALLAKKSSNHNEDLYCLGCFNSYTTENRLKEHEKICNRYDSCRIEMPEFAERIIKYAHGEKSLRALFAIYLDLE